MTQRVLSSHFLRESAPDRLLPIPAVTGLSVTPR